jgi:polysaccharide biosynthesis transport protein
MEYVLGGPIIGRIPRSRALARSGRGTRALPAPEAEAFRTVRVNLRRQLEQQGIRSLIVTSAIPGEGKTTLAWNLARIEAASGSRVLLVEADLRRPSLARSLKANGSAGLSDLLAGDEAQLQDLIRPVDFHDDVDPSAAEGGAIDVLFAGAPPANPAELLASERMQAVLEVIPDRYDLVVVDTPPTVVSDAMPILEYVGGVVVVGRIGLSTDESLIGLREQLDQLDAPTLGVVVNGDAKNSNPYTNYVSKDYVSKN